MKLCLRKMTLRLRNLAKEGVKNQTMTSAKKSWRKNLNRTKSLNEIKRQSTSSRGRNKSSKVKLSICLKKSVRNKNKTRAQERAYSRKLRANPVWKLRRENRTRMRTKTLSGTLKYETRTSIKPTHLKILTQNQKKNSLQILKFNKW